MNRFSNASAFSAQLPLWAIFSMALIGCTDSSSLSIELSFPQTEFLSPIEGNEVAEITLEARYGADVVSLSRSVTDSSKGIDLGNLTEGDEVSIAVELRAANRQILGFGRTPTPVAVSTTETTAVKLNMRRPLAYVSNQDGSLVAIDASKELATAISPPIEVSGTPVASAPSRDGGDLFVALESGGATSVSLVSTSTHRPSRQVISGLAPGVVDLIATEDGGTLVLAHRVGLGATLGGVSVVDIDEGTRQFVALGSTERIAVTASGDIFALVDRSASCAVPPRSAVIKRLSVSNPTAAVDLPFAGSAGDLAIDPSTGDVLVANPCAGQIVAFDGAGNERPFAVLSGVGALASSDGRLIAAGIDADSGINLRIFAGATELSINVPPLVERTESVDLDTDGQRAEIVAAADGAAIVDLAAVPGAERIALLTNTFYAIEPGAFGTTPAMEVTASEYLLIDASTQSTVHRLRTRCELVVDYQGEFLPNWRCGRSADQLESAITFEPETISILYGAR